MTRTWWENEEILKQFRTWLSETADEVAALNGDLTSSDADACVPASPPAPTVGLLQVVEALTAMRHELKLQTKSSRGLEEAVQTARQGLDEAIRHFRSIESREEQSAERAALPLAEAMAGLDEAMWRAGKAFEQTHGQITGAVPQRVRQVLAEEFDQLPAWRKWLVGDWPERLQRRCAEVVGELNAEEFDRLLDGYRLIQQRTRQELERHGLRRLDVVGCRVDPACMTVVAVADASEGPAETVVEELRPGYYWQEKVLRFAEVRAVATTTSNIT
jgi:molecular chaperone GrpE